MKTVFFVKQIQTFSREGDNENRLNEMQERMSREGYFFHSMIPVGGNTVIFAFREDMVTKRIRQTRELYENPSPADVIIRGIEKGPLD